MRLCVGCIYNCRCVFTLHAESEMERYVRFV